MPNSVINFYGNQVAYPINSFLAEWYQANLGRPFATFEAGTKRRVLPSIEEFIHKVGEASGLPQIRRQNSFYKDEHTSSVTFGDERAVVYMYLDHEFDTQLYTVNFYSLYQEGSRDIVDRAFAAFNALTEPVKETFGMVYMLMIGASGPTFTALRRRVNSPLEVGNYTPEVIAGYERIKRDLESAEPTGRIGIFDGTPGTGKTHLLKALLTEAKNTVFVFVSPSNLTQLTGPEVLPAFIEFGADHEGQSITLLVEDADECLAPRGADNMHSISGVLNLGDGILGQLLDVRLMMTTNAKRQQFDPAITRAGRLSSLVKVGELPPEQCVEIYKRLTGKTMEFDRPRVLAELYTLAVDNGWSPAVKDSPIGFQPTKRSTSLDNLLIALGG